MYGDVRGHPGEIYESVLDISRNAAYFLNNWRTGQIYRHFTQTLFSHYIFFEGVLRGKGRRRVGGDVKDVTAQISTASLRVWFVGVS